MPEVRRREPPDRNLALELVRVTEAGAMAAGRWVGRGDKEGGDGAAVDAMRQLVNTVSMRGVVVIGEGEKDNAPMLYNGEEVGNGDGPDREPDARIALPTRADQALIYRLSGDRNPLHSDPWFAREMAGFPTPILHGLCTYGFAGRALLAELAGGQAARLTAVAARFSAPVFPGEILTTSIWRTGGGRAVYRTAAAGPDGSNARVVLDDGAAEFTD